MSLLGFRCRVTEAATEAATVCVLLCDTVCVCVCVAVCLPRLLLDCWIDVQRRWVYLEGLFVGSPEIQTLLPKEFNKFTGLNTEFATVMNKVCDVVMVYCCDCIGAPAPVAPSLSCGRG